MLMKNASTRTAKLPAIEVINVGKNSSLNLMFNKLKLRSYVMISNYLFDAITILFSLCIGNSILKSNTLKSASAPNLELGMNA